MKKNSAPPPAENGGIKIAQRMRIAWLENIAIANGESGVSRDDITAAWEISAAQASLDIRAYMQSTGNDGRLQYNSTARRYVWHGTARTKLMDRSGLESLCRRILSAP